MPYIPEPARQNFNATVPLFYDYKFKENHLEEGVTSFCNSSSEQNDDDTVDTSNAVVSSDSFSYQNEELSDCEKEVESFFLDKLEPPPHSSTPKTLLKKLGLTPFKSLQTHRSKEVLEP